MLLGRLPKLRLFSFVVNYVFYGANLKCGIPFSLSIQNKEKV